MGAVREGDLLWTPPRERFERSRLARFLAGVERAHALSFRDYEEAHRWSVEHLDLFWRAVWDHFGVAGERGPAVLGRSSMPGAEWFPGARLSYVENLFRQADPGRPALVFASEREAPRPISWAELERDVAATAAALAGLGVGAGDRVAGYLPNRPEAVVAFLAAAALGAVWTCAPPEFGARSVVERFRQVEPKILIAADTALYGGKEIDRRAELEAIRAALPGLVATVAVPRSGGVPPSGTIAWADLLARGRGARLAPVRLPFDHPLWILYSSGTTGPPKAIVHSAGGILLEHLKSNALQLDVGPSDLFFWYTTTGWMMWNKLVSGLAAGATILLYDGSAGHPDLSVLWRLAAETGVTCMGVSAAFLSACQRAGLEPRRFDLSRLRTLGSTGSPLSPEGFAWVYEAVSGDLWLQSGSGGTDVCTAFLGGVPGAPVRAGELQGRALGAAVEAWDADGRPLVGEVGELVVTRPMPSMPLRFWNDPGDVRYRESYFEPWPGVWRHGDWIRLTHAGSAVIHGRSDATLNRHGVRLGSSEIYAVVEALPEVAEALVVDVELPDRPAWMGLFVATAPGFAVDSELEGRIRATLRRELSPRHVPDAIVAVAAIPKTLNGKKLEVPVKRVLAGVPPGAAATAGSLADPAALAAFVAIGERLRRGEL